jgi:uncharacterized protein
MQPKDDNPFKPGTMEFAMTVFADSSRNRSLRIALLAAAAFGFASAGARAQQPAAEPQARIIVVGNGKVSAAPDYAEVNAGVVTKAKTAKEATDANAKTMSAVMAALRDAGIEQKDIQTSRFSLQPVYAPPQPDTEQRLTGFSVSNQLDVTIRNIVQVGDILDRLIGAGATEIGGVQFQHSDPSKLLDRAREAAIADARRQAEVYARAAGVNLGSVAWITEASGYAPMPMAAMRVAGGMAATPIATGEDNLTAQVTVGFDFAH